jgi:putative phosphoribosyl transferase
MFQDREEAGRLLAKRLSAYRNDPTGLILALPRGGVAVGYMLSLALNLPLDVFITRKLGAPDNPEFALGAVAETGSLHLNRDAIEAYMIPVEYVEQARRALQEEIARRQVLYRGGRPLPDLTARTVLLVDDGIATGATFLASAEALRQLHVKRLVAGIPVGPPDTLRLVGKTVDEVVVLETPDPFFAVGNHYADFRQVDDATVVRYLKEAAAALRGRAKPARG